MMCATWNEQRFNPGLIISGINKIRQQRRSIVSYNGLELAWLKPTLLSAINFNPKIPQYQRGILLGRALSLNTPNGKISKNNFIKQLSAIEASYLRKKIKQYYLLTSLSIGGILPFSKLTIEEFVIKLKFSRKLYGDQGLHKSQKLPFFGEIPETYCPVIVAVENRTEVDAGFAALDALDVLRGLWNLHLNETSQLRFSSGHRPPVNAVRLGPVHTIHNPDGSRVTDQYWFEEDYVTDWGIRIFDQQTADNLKNLTHKYRHHLKRSPFKQTALNALRRYTRALDKWNWESCFLELWATLELLTGTQAQSYDVTVRRAAAMYKDYQLAREVVNHLRERRNRAVHSRESHHDIEILIYQLKRYVENLLKFYIQNPLNLSSVSDVEKFLSLPPESKTLEDQAALLQKALRFRQN